MNSRVRRAIKVALKSFAAVLLIAIVAGIIYEQVGQSRDRKRLPQIGQSVDIGGRSLNLYCSGEGSPAVIFDSGAGSSGYSWAHIHEKSGHAIPEQAPRQ
jgi:hypothetical protein